MLTRREMIRRGFFAPALLAAAKGVAAQDVSDIVLNPSPAIVPFTRRLKIPRPHLPLNRPGATALELAKAQSIFTQCTGETRFRGASHAPNDTDCDYYEVVMKPSLQEIVPGTLTPIYGYNGTYPGPTFFAQRGRTACVRFVNRIGKITSVHYHGGHTPPDSDGVPMMSFDQSSYCRRWRSIGSRTNVYPNDNPFPAHAVVPRSRRRRHRRERLSRLGRLFLLTPNHSEEDADIRAVEAQLPSGYGRYDIPMVFQDRQFNADGSFAYNNFEHDGFIGDRFLVNGVIQPYMPVARRRYRFRWLNGSNARQYQFSLSSGDKFFVIGSDGGLLPQAAEVSSLRVAPAERYEVVIDFSPLSGRLPCLPAQLPAAGVGPRPGTNHMDSCTPLVEFRIARDEADPSTIPDDLAPGVATVHQRPPDRAAGPAGPERDIELMRGNGAWQINDRFYDPNRVDVVERLWTHSTWTLFNESGGWTHPLHIHDEEFAIISRNGHAAGAARTRAQGRVQPRAERCR